MVRIAFFILALLSPFFFPWPVAAVFILAASLYLPVLALLGGVLYDILYYAHGAAGLPLGTVVGALGFVLAWAMHDFVKARIMDA